MACVEGESAPVFKLIIKSAPSLLGTWSIFDRYISDRYISVLKNTPEDPFYLDLCKKLVQFTTLGREQNILGSQSSHNAIKKCLLMQSKRVFIFKILQALDKVTRDRMLQDREILQLLTDPQKNNDCVKIGAKHSKTVLFLPSDMKGLLFEMLGNGSDIENTNESYKLISALHL